MFLFWGVSGLHEVGEIVWGWFRREYAADCTTMKERPKTGEPTSYTRVVLKNFSEYHYLKVQLVFEDKIVKISAAQFKSFILSALKELHGEVGASIPLDLLKFDGQTLYAILRIKSSGLVKLWTSLTLLGQYQGHQCSVRVLQTSPFLLALAGNSRELVVD
ncbi:ribonuclease P protein subunit p14-like isoform X2 [Bufo bufo]|uniref:ribonuclease P protein subunit p14-like isoform X2 n=1 Tax=Bufo bufo TaxID=8384 RepID=UPI001ABDDCD8|nr:ribonuclease P protein subunit p14-like isoform X2 [Bufo bufo]